MPGTVTIAFVVHHGLMQEQGLLLAASLRHFLRFDAQVVAVSPGPEEIFLKPAKQALQIFDDLDVPLVDIHNKYIRMPKKRAKQYYGNAKAQFFTNKWAILEHPWKTDYVLFLDSDTICTQAFERPDCIDATLAFRFVGKGGIRIAREYGWEKLFAACNVTPIRTDTKHRFGFVGPAMFNGGMVGLPVGKGPEFCAVWDKYTKYLWHHVLRSEHRYFSEQMALAIAVHALKWDYGLQSFPAWECKHYGDWKVFNSNARYANTAKLLFKKHPMLRAFLRCKIATPLTQTQFKDGQYD